MLNLSSRISIFCKLIKRSYCKETFWCLGDPGYRDSEHLRVVLDFFCSFGPIVTWLIKMAHWLSLQEKLKKQWTNMSISDCCINCDRFLFLVDLLAFRCRLYCSTLSQKVSYFLLPTPFHLLLVPRITKFLSQDVYY